MKDSSIGTYGVLALIVTGLLRWSALTALLATGAPWAALVTAGTLSRAPLAVLMAALPNARGSGLAHGVGRPSAVTAGNGLVAAAAVATFAGGPAVIGLFALTALVAAQSPSSHGARSAARPATCSARPSNWSRRPC